MPDTMPKGHAEASEELRQSPAILALGTPSSARDCRVFSVSVGSKRAHYKCKIISVPMPSFCEGTFRIRMYQNYSYDISNWQFGQTRLQRDTLVDSVEKGPLSIAKPISCFGSFAVKMRQHSCTPKLDTTRLHEAPEFAGSGLESPGGLCGRRRSPSNGASASVRLFFVSEHRMQRQGEADVSLVDHVHRRESLKY